MPDMPEWVSVWAWLRFVRTPAVREPLPQQDFDPEAMTLARYDELRGEWLSAGAPSLTTKQIVAAVSGSVLDEDPGF